MLPPRSGPAFHSFRIEQLKNIVQTSDKSGREGLDDCDCYRSEVCGWKRGRDCRRNLYKDYNEALPLNMPVRHRCGMV